MKKALTAIILAAAIVLGGVTAAAVTGSVSEADEAPQLFNAVCDFKTDISNNKQVGPCWYYEYTTDINNPDWIRADRWAWNNWYPNTGTRLGYIGISQKGSMQIRNNDGGITGLLPAVAYVFIPERDGFIDMYDSKATVTVSTNNAYNAKLRITKNGEVIYPESGWITLKNGESADFKDLEFQASVGDTVRFELAADKEIEKGESLYVTWNPAFLLKASRSAYGGSGILARLTAFMRGIFGGLTSSTLDDGAADTEAAAIEKTEKSAYGVYSVLDSVYDTDKAVKSNADSVWKFSLQKDFCPDFKKPGGDLPFDYTVTGSGVKITADNSGGEVIRVSVFKDGGTFSYLGLDGSVTVPAADVCLPFDVQVCRATDISAVFRLYDNTNKTELAESNIFTDKTLSVNKGKTDAHIKLYSENADSYYELYYSRKRTDSLNDLCERKIVFNAAAGEKMRFGFTAPYSGEYEISAPLGTDGKSVTYRTVIESGGDTSVLCEEKKYITSAAFCTEQATLNKGDTVWFEAYSVDECKINIGIPEFILKQPNTVREISSYKYIATDYAENKTANGYKDYANISSAEKVRPAWSFGYYNANDEKTDLKPYSIMRSGFFYCALPYCVCADGKLVTGTYGVIGNLYPTYGSNVKDESVKPLYKRNKFYGCVGTLTNAYTGNDENIGIYMRFTSPMNANARLTLTDGQSNISNLNIKIYLNGTLYKSYTNDISAGATVSLPALKKGDRVTLLFESRDGRKHFEYMGSPAVELTGAFNNIRLLNEYTSLSQTVRAAADVGISLPAVEHVAGMKFIGWYANEETDVIKAGEEFKTAADVTLTAKYVCLGDMDADNKLNVSDLSLMKTLLLGGTENADTVSDINSDGKTDIKDLVKMKKWLGNFMSDKLG